MLEAFKGFFDGENMTIETLNFVYSQEDQPDMYQEAALEGKFLDETVACFEAFASDLKTKDLARRYLKPLINTTLDGCFSADLAIRVGAKAFYRVAKDQLGPLHVSYVDEVLRTGASGDIFLFAARDSTPFYWIAKTLLETHPQNYPGGLRLVHADWNRWFMGQEDVTDPDKKPYLWGDPLLERFYSQMGFGQDRLIKIIEPGAWGSAAKAVKQNLPQQQFELWFLFSHMPDKIFGFLNHKAPGLPEEVYEMINDTGEAQPKFYLRPEKLVEVNGLVVPDLSNKLIQNQTVQAWAIASRQGSIDAALQYDNAQINVRSHVDYLHYLSHRAKYEFVWTGMLPENTETWPEGNVCKASWSLGKIAPLADEGLVYEI